MIEHKKLNEVLGSNGIFTRIMTAHTVPWSEDTDITGALLDFEYIYNQSGDKIISPAVYKNLTDGELSTADFNKLCDVAYMMYNKRWARLWEILTAEFNPLQNYDMSESKTINYGKIDTNSGTDTTLRTGTDTHAESGTDSILRSGTDTNTESGTDSLLHGETHTLSGNDQLQHGETHTLSGNDGTTDTRSTENEVSAFNSSSYQDATKSTNSGGTSTTYGKTDTASGTDRTTYGKTDTASGTDQTTYGHVNTESRNMTDATTYGHTDQETRNMSDALTHGHVLTASGRDTETLTRSGNIGVTTSQQMAQSSLDLWKWNYFYDIFRDIDSIFTIPTY